MMHIPDGRKIRLQAAVGKAVQRHRLEQGISRKQLAERIGIGDSHFGKMEEGYQPFTVLQLHDIAHELDVCIDELVPVLTDEEAAE